MEGESILDIVTYYASNDEIYDAINTYDMAKIVRAATNVLKKTAYTPPVYEIEGMIANPKCKITSMKLRNIGNEHYKAGRYRTALVSYNMALSFAPKDSYEMMLGYGNRSAVMFTIRYFTACQEDIKTCLSMGCPKSLADKLSKRSNATLPYMHEELLQTVKSPFINSFFQFDCKRNAEVPCAIADVAFENRDGEKRVTAGKDIRVGTVVVIERAFATCVPAHSAFLTCYYCNKMALRLHPCEGCQKALFCGNECRDLCMKEYHRIECRIVDCLTPPTYEEPVSILMTRTAIKMSLKLGWDAFITASKEIGASRMRTATVRQTFNSEEPLSMLSYDDNKHLLEGKMFNGSVICSLILDCLNEVPDYFPKEATKRLAAKEAMSRIMLHLYVTFTYKIPIVCASYNFKSKCCSAGMQTNYGWFSMSSKLKHSCEPNLIVVGLNDSVGLVALRTIKKGEELTISFIEHFYDFEILHNSPVDHVNVRATRLFLATKHICACRVCTQDWDVNSDVYIKMTNRQNKLFLKSQNFDDIEDDEAYMNICAVLDAFPYNSTKHKNAYEMLRKIINLVQCIKTKNKCWFDFKI